MKKLSLDQVPKVGQGKVREIFAVGEDLLMVATDRLSAFDVVLPDEIPHKGRVLTQLSLFWFARTAGIIENHLITSDVDRYPESLRPHRDVLRGRSMLVRRCSPLPVECVVRGYLAGSGWKDYLSQGAVCGLQLPSGLVESQALPQPIFSPSTKASQGHDINITYQEMVDMVGPATAEQARSASLRLFKHGSEYASERGLILCDTKFEFGLADDRLVLIDELLTPDSSRFWPASQYRPGAPQPSFDKQFVRDCLETLDWDKTSPGPSLSSEVIAATSRRYLEAYRLLTGRELETH